MPELTWLGKDAIRHHHLDVPYRPFVPTATFEAPGTPPDAPWHRIVHGDNLEALKSLLPEFAGRVQCIYIDPPYNTGNEGWAYNDNVSDPRLLTWLHRTVGKEADDLSRHDKWLCMMYPRLHLLHKLLADDGAIFISIDDNEVAHLRCVMDEVFGPGRFIAELIWKSRQNKDNRNINRVSNDHEYVLCYGKRLNGVERSADSYTNPDNDKRGPWSSENMAGLADATQRPNLHYDLIRKETGVNYGRPDRGWRYEKSTMDRLIEEDRIIWPPSDSGRPRRKKFLSELGDTVTGYSSIIGQNIYTRNGTSVIKEIFGESKFDFPKPVELLEEIIGQATNPDSIILDSFAGSGTTLHAVAKLNARDGGRRQCLLVEVEAYADTLTAERARRVLAGYGAVPGLGGRFAYGELGAPLFEAATGLLSAAAPPAALRQYVWWQETGTQLPPAAPGAPACHPAYLGTTPDGTRLYFDYDPARASTLDAAWLAAVQVRAPRYVVYADACELPEDWLAAHGVVYKKIPRDIGRL
jgi:adenine-specific DNA-methyltransferase